MAEKCCCSTLVGKGLPTYYPIDEPLLTFFRDLVMQVDTALREVPGRVAVQL